MIAPESITVPSRSNRTTGKRIGLMLATAAAIAGGWTTGTHGLRADVDGDGRPDTLTLARHKRFFVLRLDTRDRLISKTVSRVLGLQTLGAGRAAPRRSAPAQSAASPRGPRARLARRLQRLPRSLHAFRRTHRRDDRRPSRSRRPAFRVGSGRIGRNRDVTGRLCRAGPSRRCLAVAPSGCVASAADALQRVGDTLCTGRRIRGRIEAVTFASARLANGPEAGVRKLRRHEPPSVVDAFEVQPPWRRRRAGLAARRAGQQARDPLRRQLEHRPDERAHHVAEEAVRSDLELERIAASMPLRTQHVALEDLVLRLLRSERAEVVFADQ